MPKLLTVEMLREWGACYRQRQIFADEWPDGAAINAQNIQRALALDLDVDFCCRKLLPTSARPAHDQATASAWAKYRKVVSVAWTEYLMAKAAAFLSLYTTKAQGAETNG